MLGINEKLKSLENQGKTINIAIAGIGQMGSGIISHLEKMKSFKILALGDKNLSNSVKKLTGLGYQESDIYSVEKNNHDDLINSKIKISADILRSETINDPNIHKSEINKAVNAGKTILTNDLAVLSHVEDVDVIVDATGNPEAGAQIAIHGLLNRKHIITLNVETDTAIGPLLKKIADNRKVVYSVAAGDEPAALKELYDFANALNLEVIAAGKGKNNPLNRQANPATLKEYAEAKGASIKMMTSFVDGTKSMVEMACFSNSTGIIPDCRGMHAPEADLKDLTTVFCLKKDGGILDKKGIVDFVIGNVAPGVFLVYTTEQEALKKELKYLLYGNGPNYLLYRPFHLASIEAPLSIARAYFYNEPTIASKNGLVSEVVTAAKKDLKPGEIIDGIGGYSVYGLIETYHNAKQENLLPIGLCEGAAVKKEIKKGEIIKYDDVDINEDSIIYKLRKLQEILIN
ncbi:MAG: SAF domain-containing protein [Actinobacteria bacterium]|nr:SAF domain-containing protein [Actinomycetota bacterium]